MQFSVSGTKYFPITNPGAVKDTLPVAVYSVRFNPDMGFYLEYRSTNFPVPNQLYSPNGIDINQLSNLFVTRYQSSSNNLGVLLTGLKGTGKSLLLKATSNLALAHNVPVLVVDSSLPASALSHFLTSIQTDCAVVFDEFEKYYTDNSDVDNNQEALLSFFDGTSNSHKLIILTANDTSLLSTFFINRPSRIRYVIDYPSLPIDFVTEFLSTKLADPSILPQVIDELELIDEINFDLLNVCVEELNMAYPLLPVNQIIKQLNISETKVCYNNYTITAYVNGVEVSTDIVYALDVNDLNRFGENIRPYYLEEYIKANHKSAHLPLRLDMNNTMSIKGRTKLQSTIQLGDDTLVLLMEKVKFKHSPV